MNVLGVDVIVLLEESGFCFEAGGVVGTDDIQLKDLAIAQHILKEEH